MSARSGGVTLGPESSEGPIRIPALDGLRAIAVLGVIASHSGIFGLGWLGVDLFFALSGYLITGILVDAKSAGGAGGAREYFVPFYIRRALRILPLAWLVALLMGAVRGEWTGIPWYMGYLVNWLPASPPPTDLGHYWSLAVEEQFYLAWPAVVFYASRRGLLRASLAILALDMACRFAFSTWPPSFATPQFLDLASFARADALVVGALLAQRQRSGAGGWGPAARWALPVAVASGLAVVAIRWLEIHSAPAQLTYNVKWPTIAVFMGSSLLFVLVRPPAFLRWRWLSWIGQISYGVYVIHSCFGHWLHAHFRSAPVVFVLQVGVTIPLAAASWYLFESPILKQKWRWPMPSRRAPAPVVADLGRAS